MNVLTGTTSAGMGSTVIMLVLMIAIFYFMLIRPENKRKKEAEQMRGDGGVGDARRARTHQHLHIGIVGANDLAQRTFHLRAHLGCGQNQAVVAVDGTLDAAGPSEGLVRAKEYCADGEQSLRDAAFQMLHFYLFSFQNVSLLTE